MACMVALALLLQRGVQSWWLQLMLLDVILQLLHPGPCGLAGDFQPRDCHGEANGGYNRNRTLSHHCLVLPWSQHGHCCNSCGEGGCRLGLGFHCSRAPAMRAAPLQDLVYFALSEQHGAVSPPPHRAQVGAG